MDVSTLLKMFNRRWWWSTLLVVLGMIFLARLGFWQLDRLEQRRTQNAYVASRWNEDPLDINQNMIPDDLKALGYRRLKASGTFDYANQIVLSNQQMPDLGTGVVVITPLLLADNQAVLVARGLLYYNDAQGESLAQFNEASEATIVGLARASDTNAHTPIQDTPQKEWHRIDIPAIQEQMPYQLLPFFIEQLPEPGRNSAQMPLRQIPEDVQMISDEGSHFSYAIQWFTFALMFGVGYPFFIRWQEMREKRIRNENVQNNEREPAEMTKQVG